jgi:hypothetical protein
MGRAWLLAASMAAAVAAVAAAFAAIVLHGETVESAAATSRVRASPVSTSIDSDARLSATSEFGFEDWMSRLEVGSVLERCRVVRRFSSSPMTTEQTAAIVVRAAHDKADGVRYYLAVESAEHSEWIMKATASSFAALARDPDEIIAGRTVSALRIGARDGNETALDVLRGFVRDGPIPLKSSALVSLAVSGHATADDVASIVASLHAVDVWTRGAAARAAELLGPRASSCARRLAEMLAHDDCAFASAEALAKVRPDYGGDGGLVACVVSGLDGRYPLARRSCCRMLRHAAPPAVAAIPRLDQIAADDSSAETQVSAIVTLAILGRDAKSASEQLRSIRSRIGRWLAIYVDEEIRWTGETDVVARELEREFWDER